MYELYVILMDMGNYLFHVERMDVGCVCVCVYVAVACYRIQIENDLFCLMNEIIAASGTNYFSDISAVAADT